MTFEEIIPSIKQCPRNSYEINNDIKTGDVKCVFKKNYIALFIAEKNDNSLTLFVARKPKNEKTDDWIWFSPTEEEGEVYPNEFNYWYKYVNECNEKNRN